MGEKHNWWCICWGFPTNLPFLWKEFGVLRDLFHCSAVWVMHLPGPATLQREGGDAGSTLNLLFLT